MTDAQTQSEFRQQSVELPLTEPEISQTKPQIEEETGVERNKGGRPRKTPNVIPWTVRGVDLETRTAIEKVASRNGKTIGQYMNEDIRSYAQEQLRKGSQPPARQEDLRTELDDIKGMISDLAQRIPTNEKKGILRRIFG